MLLSSTAVADRETALPAGARRFKGLSQMPEKKRGVSKRKA
jgi:hypothetical protein